MGAAMRIQLAEIKATHSASPFDKLRMYPGRAVVDQTPGGILLPPGVAEKLNARAALAEAEALVAALPVRQGPDVADLLAAVANLSNRVEQLQGQVRRQEARLAAPPAAQPNPAAELLALDPLFLDLETTGLSKADAITEIGLIDSQGRTLLSTLLDPGRPIPERASQVSGISDAMVAGAPRWAQVKPQLRALLWGRTVAAFNAPFERKFLPKWAGVRWVCVYELANAMLGKRPYGGGLAARLAQLGLAAEAEHTAVGDAVSCLRLVQFLVRSF
jgi:hypothetical protein